MKSNLYLLVFTIFFFTDPTVFFRVIVRNDTLSVFVVSIFVLIILTKCLSIAKTKLFSENSKIDFYLVLAYIILSSSVHIYLGQDLNYLLQHEIVVLQCLFLYMLLIETKYRNTILHSFFLASFLHVITIFPIFSFITNQLSVNTAYVEGDYSIGFFSRRATGFFNSPGQLSMFALGGLSLGLHYFKQNRYKIGIPLLINSVLLGIAALSRSFFVVSLMVVLFYMYKSPFKFKVRFGLIFLLVAIFLSDNETFLSYYDLISERMLTVFTSSENDRLSGETGLFEVVKVLINDPLFGNPILVDGKAILAWNGEIFVRPHTGLLCILCYYGIVFGFPMFYLVMKGLRVTIKEWFISNMNYSNSSIGLNDNPFIFGFIAVFILVLVEPLLENAIFFLFLFGLIHCYSQRRNKSV